MKQNISNRYFHSVRILSEGGRLSVQKMKLLLEAARGADLTHMYIDSRQSLFFNTGALPTRKEQVQSFTQQLSVLGVSCAQENEQNIVSSLPSAQVFAYTSWLDTAMYHVLLRELQEVGFGCNMNSEPHLTRPSKSLLSISLIDNRQSFIPHLCSELNFIASETEDYWYLYIRYGQVTSPPVLWPFLIGGPCLAQFARSLADDLVSGCDLQKCVVQYSQDTRWQMMIVNCSVEKAHAALPRYEGFISYGQNLHALGIVRADQTFDLLMVEQMLKLMQHQNITDLYTTPWGSLLIKGIHEENIPVWNRLLCLHHCDVGLSYGHLNWLIQTKDFARLPLIKLRSRLAQNLQDNNLRTWGLTFALVDDSVWLDMPCFASIIVLAQNNSSWLGLSKRARYSLWSVQPDQFSTHQYTCVAAQLDEQQLATQLVEVVDKYQKNIGLSRQKSIFVPFVMPLFFEVKNSDAEHGSYSKTPAKNNGVFLCRYCETEYHEDMGEPSQNVAPHTPFTQLTNDFHCPVCEHGKSAFDSLQLKIATAI